MSCDTTKQSVNDNIYIYIYIWMYVCLSLDEDIWIKGLRLLAARRQIVWEIFSSKWLACCLFPKRAMSAGKPEIVTVGKEGTKELISPKAVTKETRALKGLEQSELPRCQGKVSNCRDQALSGKEDNKKLVSIFSNCWSFHKTLVKAKQIHTQSTRKMPQTSPSNVLQARIHCLVFSFCLSSIF